MKREEKRARVVDREQRKIADVGERSSPLPRRELAAPKVSHGAAQIAELIEKRLHPAGVMVVVQARHLCMEMRGVGKAGLTTTTSAVRGVFEDGRERERVLAFLAPQRSHPGLMLSSPYEV